MRLSYPPFVEGDLVEPPDELGALLRVGPDGVIQPPSVNGNPLTWPVGFSVPWGGMTGNIADQEDLQDALDEKQDIFPPGTVEQYFRGDMSLATFPTELSAFADDVGYATSATLAAHTSDTTNPHNVTKAQIGLGNADDTSDLAKPVSNATQTALDLKAPLASPTFTGTPVAPTQTAGNNSTRIATTAYVDAAIGVLIQGAPGLLDTLDEIATALGDDPNFATTITASLTGKMVKTANLGDLSDVAIARTNLGLGTLAVQSGTFSGTSSGTNTGDQIVPVNTTASANQFFTAYNSATGAFTKTQPAFSDISGTATDAQIPATISGKTAITATTITGSTTVAAGSVLSITGNARLFAPGSGVLLLSNLAGADIDRVQWGGTGATFPSIKRSGTTLACRLANDSADCPITASIGTFSSSVKFNGATSGVTTVAAPAVAGAAVITLPSTTGTLQLVDDTALTSYTPTVTAGTGTITSYTVNNAGYKKLAGKVVFVRLSVTITDVGTAGSFIIITLPPFTATGSSGQVLAGSEDAVNGAVLRVWIDGAATTMRVRKYDNTFYAANGYMYNITGTYETA